MQAVTSQDPFVGRVAELNALAEAFAQASRGHSGIVCVEGVAGIGKTALVRAFLAAAAPALVVSASGDEAETTVPWGAISQLARSVPAGWRGALRQLGRLSPNDDPLASGHLLLDALGAMVRRRPA